MNKLQEQQQDSPYLSPNKVFSANHNSNYFVPYESNVPQGNNQVSHSPYLMEKSTGFSGGYMSVPVHQEQMNHIKYRGVYSDVAREVKRDRY